MSLPAEVRSNIMMIMSTTIIIVGGLRVGASQRLSTHIYHLDRKVSAGGLKYRQSRVHDFWADAIAIGNRDWLWNCRYPAARELTAAAQYW